ncbi:MAG: hypothetical protein WA918_02110 [Erythrobacter sp.]
MPLLAVRPAKFFFLAASMTLAACGASDDSGSEGAADDFAARIGSGSSPAPAGTVAPTIAKPLPNAAPGVFTPGTATDPASATCGANRIGDFIGRAADDVTRAAIMDAASDVREVRFILPGSDYIEPDPTSPRLNMMLDQQNIIRDARCG